MKKTVCLVLALLLALMALAGCGGGPAPQNSNAAYDTPAYEAPATAEEGVACPEDWSDWAEPDTEPAPEDDWRERPLDSEEEYDDAPESPFKDVLTSPLSTFSSDVDTASYSNMRRFLQMGALPEGVRVEELVNYFDYDYPRPSPQGAHPFTVTAEVAPCPWNADHQLAMIGVQGAQLESREEIDSNIVFLLDVSGSMNEENKLPLLKESFKLLIGELSENDVVSIVTYAGSERVVADSIPGHKQRKLKGLMDDLRSGGSTAGAQGLRTAYKLAEKNFIEGGNNRIILATDGDFNVGESSDAAMTKLIEEERGKGVYISVLGFGMGNLKDSKMESIADNGNGNYAYIDTLNEARKVLVDEFESTLFTIARDLKLQVEFNPGVVSQYRLIGYNNRRMENEDFNDDTKDAGDIGAGHSVTAFYELVPAGGAGSAGVDALKYQSAEAVPSREYMTVKLRYKQPDAGESTLVEVPVGRGAYSEELSQNFGFASAVAEFGLLLTDSRYQGNANAKNVIERAREYKGADRYGLRAEFAELVEIYRELAD